ncbi:unnamed protein product [Phytophthora lilii]|uniref:Unnamed protein product n=1 Tax=Phytophthora lilii TaxID=2077276 RepID=A0A9W6T9C9_9STRA|nr:unnamed protein product [Phytophthora lilii]
MAKGDTVLMARLKTTKHGHCKRAGQWAVIHQLSETNAIKRDERGVIQRFGARAFSFVRRSGFSNMKTTRSVLRLALCTSLVATSALSISVDASRCKPSRKYQIAGETDPDSNYTDVGTTSTSGESSVDVANDERSNEVSDDSSSGSFSSSRSITRPFQKVTSLQARVQGDMPAWNEEHQRFVSKYYTTSDEKYRAVLDTVNMAAVEGALKYVQAECINASVVTNCKRKNNIKYVVFYQTTVVQPTAAIEYYTNATDQYDFAVEHCPFMPMDGGQCDPNEDGSFPDVCNQYIGADGQPDLGFCIGGTLQDNEVIAPYPHSYWFSFPNSCPQSRWNDKTASCRAEFPGGMCALGVEPDGESCTFSYEVLGYIPLDDVVGITSMINPNTGVNYVDYSEFCAAGGVEFSVTVDGDGVTWLDGLDFWANPGDSDANAERAEKLVSAYSALVERNSVTSDGGIMQPLPTVASLTAINPPCYENSELCAHAEFGCKRSYRSQICEMCTSADSVCVKALN